MRDASRTHATGRLASVTGLEKPDRPASFDPVSRNRFGFREARRTGCDVVESICTRPDTAEGESRLAAADYGEMLLHSRAAMEMCKKYLKKNQSKKRADAIQSDCDVGLRLFARALKKHSSRHNR